MKKVLITGSRNCSLEMIVYAKQIVKQAMEAGDEIIVGDADGIDKYVIAECDIKGVPVSVHGAYSRMRRRTLTGTNCIHSGNYTERDQLMAQKCDVCYAVWDGQSKGTKATYDFAKSLGKGVCLKSF